MKRSLVLISFVLWIIVIYAGSSTLKAKCLELRGIYFRQKCYTYQNETYLNWNDAMDFCNNLVPGFTSHLVHLLSSKTLNVLYDLTRPIPTGVYGEWRSRRSAFIGARSNVSATGYDIPHHFGRFALTKTDLINDVQVSNTYAGQMPRTIDTYPDPYRWAMVVYSAGSTPYPWGRGESRDYYPMYFFCQTNDQQTTSGILRSEFNRINKLPMLATKTLTKKKNTLGCLWECHKHPLCRGFNYKSSESKCELTSWDADDVAPDEIDDDNEWRHYLVE